MNVQVNVNTPNLGQLPQDHHIAWEQADMKQYYMFEIYVAVLFPMKVKYMDY